MDLWIGWTSVEREDDAQRLARQAVERHLAACVQVDGPLQSFYWWNGSLEQAREYRLTFKFIASSREALQHWLRDAHPYENPEWVALPAQSVAPAYLAWARREGTIQSDD